MEVSSLGTTCDLPTYRPSRLPDQILTSTAVSQMQERRSRLRIRRKSSRWASSKEKAKIRQRSYAEKP